MGKGIITILSNIIWLCVNAQHSSEFLQIDKIALQIPDSLTHSTTDLADYFNTRFSEAGEKSRAIFSWITGNIVYDIDQRFMPKYYNNPDDVINEVLIYKKGVCVHFAELLCAVANKSGIKSYVIFGCTKQNGTIDNIPHAWCACLIDSGWLLVDPTWGSGYIQNSRFIHKVNDKYYNVKPEEIINSHYPFDPLWQFSYYPVSFTEFSSGKLQQKEGKKYFNFADTLYRYENQPATARLKSSYKRIKDYGAGNLLVEERLENINREIEYHNNNQNTEQYNSAVLTYNSGIKLLNSFIDYRNKQFNPLKPDSEIKQMLDTAASTLKLSRQQINNIKLPDENMKPLIKQLNNAINDASIRLNEQKAFLDKYIKTGKLSRKSLFYK